MLEKFLKSPKGVNLLEEMPAEAIIALEVAITESYQNNSGVSHEAAKQMFEKWGKA
jgi:hypothetical protein